MATASLCIALVVVASRTFLMQSEMLCPKRAYFSKEEEVAAWAVNLKTYPHTMEKGHVWQYVRNDSVIVEKVFLGRDASGKKDIRQRLPNSDSWGLMGLKLNDFPFYREDDIRSLAPGSTIYLVEGERKADMLHFLGRPATYHPGLVNGNPPKSLTLLKGKHIVLWPDFDKAGREQMLRTGAALKDIALTLMVVDVYALGTNNFNAPLKPTDDVVDFEARGGNLSSLPLIPFNIWANHSDGRIIIQDIVARNKRYCYLEKHEHLVIAFWILHTHLFGKPDELRDVASIARTCKQTPYLLFTSAESGTGKSLVLDLVAELVRNPVGGDVSAAYSARVVETNNRPTLIVDELGGIFRSQEGTDHQMVTVWKNGWTTGRGSSYGRVAKNEETRSWSTFCPKMGACVGRDLNIDEQLSRRFINIRMEPHDEEVDELEQIHLDYDSQEDATANEDRLLRERCQTYCQNNEDAIAIAWKKIKRPKTSETLGPKERQKYRSLLALAEHAGMYSELEKAVLVLEQRRDPRRIGFVPMLLHNIVQIIDKAEFRHLKEIATETLCSELKSSDNSDYAAMHHGSGIFGRDFNFRDYLTPSGDELKSKNITLPGGRRLKGYSADDLRYCYQRYAQRFFTSAQPEEAPTVDLPLPSLGSAPDPQPSLLDTADEEVRFF